MVNYKLKSGINMMKILNITLVLSLLIFTACSEEFLDPSNPVSAQVEESTEGLTGLAVGLQNRWSVGRQSPVYNIVAGPGFTTNELRLINPGNVDENEVDLGGDNLTTTNRILSNMWEQSLLVRAESQIILDKVDAVVFNEGIKAGLIATASLYKALTFGTLIQYFEQIPLTVGKDVSFHQRSEVLNEAIQTLLAGKAAAPSISSEFLASTTGTIDVANSINALLARYYLMAGNYGEAISAANAVDLNVASSFSYNDVDTNPIAFVSTKTNNVFQPINLTLGLPVELQPDTTDQRLAFYFKNVNAPNQDYRAGGFLDENGDGIPLYLPGEMLLIKAEAYARNNDLPSAITALDQIITKDPANDPFGIGAGFATGYAGAQTQEAVLTEIYKQRCMELYMSGLRFEDSRRFSRPGPGEVGEERNRNWYPYPSSERINNMNTPSDPAI